jgi:hypothetical protein
MKILEWADAAQQARQSDRASTIQIEQDILLRRELDFRIGAMGGALLVDMQM